ncbi:MAG: hypothetical protein JW795_01965 [Chitinivibrionales bacterium]|nr:hypothetical protein [Chitinivibrionales bacterium]
MNGRVVVVCTCIMLGLLCWSCQKKSNEGAVFATVGGKPITQESFDAFRKMREYYPAYFDDRNFPATRPEATQCVETEVLFLEAKAVQESVRQSLDWQWKERFYTAHLYLLEILDQNLGATNQEIEAYYLKHKESFKRTIKVEVKSATATAADKKADTTAGKDTSGAAKPAVVTKDSVTYLSLAAAKDEIVTTLFLATNPPDTSFFVKMNDTTKSGTDTARIRSLWINQVRRDVPAFFMKKLYAKKIGKPYPDSLQDVYGPSKIIKPADVDVIINWVSPEGRQQYKPVEKQRFLVEWLLKWKFFAEEGQKMGYHKRADVVKMTQWAYKFTTAFTYVNNTLMPEYRSAVKIDTALCYYEFWDRSSVAPGIKPDSASLSEIITSDKESKASVAFEEYMYQMRLKAGVTFLTSDHGDGKMKDPKELSRTADSLYAAGSSREAEKIYRDLVDNFPFTAYGQNGLVELAKILTESESYSEAVRNYRRFLLLSSEADRRCNIFFMIGFVYGEYLNKPDVAEAHYKWILKNAPQCELADDAEFMYLHLDEPMIGVDELQGEAKRQGKSETESSLPKS